MTIPACGRILYDAHGGVEVECEEVGPHWCEARAKHVERFFEELLCHTKGTYARKRFKLADWQRDEIIYPLFGKVVWSDEHQSYKRQYEVAWIEIARKALAVETPVLTANRGWITMADIRLGDEVYTLDGSTTTVNWVSPVFTEERFEVRTRGHKALVAGADHEWMVRDRNRAEGGRKSPVYPKVVLSTADMLYTGLKGSGGGFRYAVPPIDAIKGVVGDLPIDPYCLGAWLGDGTSANGTITAHEDDEPFMRAQFEASGYETSDVAHKQQFYVKRLVTDLRALRVLGNKHVPEQYLLAPEAERLALLRGLMDTDGNALVTPERSLRVTFSSKLPELAESVQFLARSLGFDARVVTIVPGPNDSRYGKGPYYDVIWTVAPGDVCPFRMPRKALSSPAKRARATDSIKSITPVGVGKTRCIGVEHPDHVFLAGRDLMPTANCGKTELLAGIQLYILLAEGEYSAELYSVAKDIKQARLCFDVAAQMVKLNPILSKRCKVLSSAKRIVKIDSNSVYAVIASDGDAALGSNPSSVAADEILAWPATGQNLWDALTTGQGSMARLQPLIIAATTAGSDSESFGGLKHASMAKIAENPESAPHIFVFMRNTPRDADPFDEKNWYHANPALGDFLSLEKMRKYASDAKRDALALRGFQQFNLNQWTSSAVAWYPMHTYDECAGTVHANAELTRSAFAGRECWLGIDLAARQDLCAIAYLFPDGNGGCDFLWRFWVPEAQFWKLNAQHSGRFVQWAKDGWIQTTEGEVLDFQQVYGDIESDARRFTILGADADKWSSDPVIQEIQTRTYVQDIMAYENQFRHMSDGMHRLLEMGKEKKMRHHGNPVARWCFDACEARIAPYNPDLIRPDKPNRGKVSKRIDAVPAAIMAVNAWVGRGSEQDSIYATDDVFTVNF